MCICQLQLPLRLVATHPAPLRPEPIQTQSRFVVVRWEPPPCNGGHRIIGYTLRYKEVTNGSADYHYVFNINRTTLKYTMDQLNPSTSYLVSIQSTDANFVGSPFSRENTVVTLPPGEATGVGGGCGFGVGRGLKKVVWKWVWF